MVGAGLALRPDHVDAAARKFSPDLASMGAASGRVILLDTDLPALSLWSERALGGRSVWLAEQTTRLRVDRYLLTDLVEGQGASPAPGVSREVFFLRCQGALAGKPHTRLSGTLDDRFELARASSMTWWPGRSGGRISPGEPPGVRREMAELWAFRALAEASAGRRLRRVADGLERLGADAALVALARRAPQDEERHRRLCLDVAASFGPWCVRRPPWRGQRGRGARRRDPRACHFRRGVSLLRERDAQPAGDDGGAGGDEARGAPAGPARDLRDEVGHSALGWRFLEAEGGAATSLFWARSCPRCWGCGRDRRLFRAGGRARRRGAAARAGLAAPRGAARFFPKMLADRVFPRLEALAIRN